MGAVALLPRLPVLMLQHCLGGIMAMVELPTGCCVALPFSLHSSLWALMGLTGAWSKAQVTLHTFLRQISPYLDNLGSCYLYPQPLHAFPCLSAFLCSELSLGSGAWGLPPAAAGMASGSGSFSSCPRGTCFAFGGACNQTAILPAKKGCFLFAASLCSLLSYLPYSLWAECDQQIAQPPARAVPFPATADPITVAAALLD